MTGSDPSNQANPVESQETPASDPKPDAPEQSSAESQAAAEESRRRILIGSQRDPAAYRARRRDWIPIEEPEGQAPTPTTAATGGPGEAPTAEQPRAQERQRPREKRPPRPPKPARGPQAAASEPARQGAKAALDAPIEQTPVGRFPPPNLRDQLPPDLEDELNRAMGDARMDELIGSAGTAAEGSQLEPESQHTGRVVAVRRDDVFVELGGREQGVISIRQFSEPPQPGAALEVVVQRFHGEEGLYELSLPGTAVSVEDWGDLREGMLVQARITGHNTGGLECEVNHIRGFIPVSQISLYRVEDLAPLVGQQFTCLVTEANPDRRNLVLSRRAILEREREEARKQFLESLQPGQVHEGVVRKLVDFGAFVELGNGVDGLLHISQLAWHRVNHPSEVLAEGQTIKVKVERVDPATGKIGLAYRDLFESPWAQAATKFPPNSVVRGTVTKLMEFGAFVQLEPGVEGLVHISELSPKRVWRTSDVVKEGDQIEALVLTVDTEAQRISLSMRALAPPPQPTKKEEEPAAADTRKTSAKRSKPDQPLQGGLGRTPGGQQSGLKW